MKKKLCCSLCKKEVKSEKELFIYVDGNNISITKNSPELCKECYERKYTNESKRTY